MYIQWAELINHFPLFQQTMDAISKFEEKLKMILLPTDDRG